ncbi:MAG: hypothetical protein NVSMB19_10270 [Vulcanimicrobiaceae bacterium]
MLPSVGGLGGTFTLPSNNAPSGTTFTMTLYTGDAKPAFLASTVLPTFFPLVQGTPLAYIVFQGPSAPVSFNSYAAGMTFTASALSGSLQYFAGACVLSGGSGPFSTCSTQPVGASIYTVLGPIPRSGNALTAGTSTFAASFFQPTPASLTLPANQNVLGFVYGSPLGPALQGQRTRGFRGDQPQIPFVGVGRR